jgi:hypothetical protein
MCREGDVLGYRVMKSGACAICVAGGRFRGALTLRLKLAQGVENVGMVRIDDVANMRGGRGGSVANMEVLRSRAVHLRAERPRLSSSAPVVKAHRHSAS